MAILFAFLRLLGANTWDLASMKALLGGDAPSCRLLGYERGPDPHRPTYAFLAADTKSGRRYLVRLRQPAVVIRFDRREIQLEPRMPFTRVSSMDLEGVRIGNHVILFHTETTMTRSTFFEVESGSAMRYLVAGLVPGSWEIWRGGLLEDPDAFVNKESGVLYFEGPPGNYYLKRLY